MLMKITQYFSYLMWSSYFKAPSFTYPQGRRDSDSIIPLKVLGFCLFSTQAAGK